MWHLFKTQGCVRCWVLGGKKDNLLVTADLSTKARDGVLKGDPCHRTAKTVKVEDGASLGIQTAPTAVEQ